MNVIKVDFTRSRNGESDEDLITSVQLHDQMLSCLDFVVEKSRQLYHDDVAVAPLLLMMEKISDERAHVVEAVSARKRSGSVG